MRSLLLVALMVSTAHAQRVSPRTGWCPSTAPPGRPTFAKNFEIRGDTFAVQPMRKAGFSYYTGSYARWTASQTLGFVSATVNGGKIQFIQEEAWCKDMRVARPDPCDGKPNHIVVPRKVLFEEAVPAGACIHYASGLGGGRVFAVGLANQMRVYTIDENNKPIQRVASLPTPRLEAVELVHGMPDMRLVLQEANGPLWTARWDGKRPILERIVGINERVLSFQRANDAHLYAFTQSGLYKLDGTYTVKWKLAGEIWGFVNQDVPERLFVVAIDRSGPKPRVLLKTVDRDGKILRETVVYEGPASAAEVNAVETGYVVFVAP